MLNTLMDPNTLMSEDGSRCVYVGSRACAHPHTHTHSYMCAGRSSVTGSSETMVHTCTLLSSSVN